MLRSLASLLSKLLPCLDSKEALPVSALGGLPGRASVQVRQATIGGCARDASG